MGDCDGAALGAALGEALQTVLEANKGLHLPESFSEELSELICKHMVHMLNGSIGVRSRPGAGSCFARSVCRRPGPPAGARGVSALSVAGAAYVDCRISLKPKSLRIHPRPPEP